MIDESEPLREALEEAVRAYVSAAESTCWQSRRGGDNDIDWREERERTETRVYTLLGHIPIDLEANDAE